MRTKVVNGFVWLLVTSKAKEIWSSGTFEMFILNDDGTESAVELYGDIEYANENGLPIGVEVGSLVDIIKQLTQ
jgi:hypothetical protein